MKSFLLMMLSLLLLAPIALADGPDDDYVNIYTLIQQGDSLDAKGEPALALTKYSEAQGALFRFKKSYPDTYTKVVKYRLDYLQNKIDLLNAKIAALKGTTNTPPAGTNAPASPTPSTAPSSNVPASPPPAPSAEFENQIKVLQEQVKQLQDDRAGLEAKLKEALAARPAEVDPRELARMREQLTSLQKENALLKADLESSKTNTPVAAGVSPELEKARHALAEANQKIDALSQANSALNKERQALQDRMKQMGVNDSGTAALREENEILKKQVAELKKSAPAAPRSELEKKLREAQAQIATMQSDQEILRLQKIAMENHMRMMMATNGATPPAAVTNAPPAASVPTAALQAMDSVTANRIAQLEAQRDELQKSLEAATRDAQGRRKGKATAERMEEMARQLASLRARIVTFESARIPYTAEEQALFSAPDATLNASAHSRGRKPPKELPAEAQPLISDARRYFMDGEFDKAEAKYMEALKLAPKNPGLLSDLASIQLEEGKTAEAEKSINAAIQLDPDDSFNLLVQGQLKFRQKKFDEAFDSLSRAAELSPENPRIQNALGLTLSEKGLRGPAETAFRKAIQIDPGYADAHANLAVVYATQQPPLMELARWHYQKALAAGLKPSPQLEKLLEPNRAAAQ